jgi:hypothetical protein
MSDKTSEAPEAPVKTYIVNGTMSMAAWIAVEAESEADAVDQATWHDANMWEYDTGTAEIEMNVTPMVEERS